MHKYQILHDNSRYLSAESFLVESGARRSGKFRIFRGAFKQKVFAFCLTFKKNESRSADFPPHTGICDVEALAKEQDVHAHQ